MDARPLRELLADLVGDAGARQEYGSDPAGYLAAHGHPDLPEPLVAEAVVSYADTAPVEVAEVLAPYVAAHGPVPSDSEPSDWFGLLTSADVETDDPFDESLEVAEPADWADPVELDFGAGHVSEASSVVSDVPDAPVDEAAPDVETAPEPEWSSAPFTPEPPIEGLDLDEDEPEDPLD